MVGKNDLKEWRVKKEINRLKKLLKEIPLDKMKVAEGLIQRTAFMHVTLEELEEDINANGTVETFSQGEGVKYDRERPAVRIYNATIKNYSAACKQLFDFIPEGKNGQGVGDELLGFLKNRGARK